jgi:hypothetical protein
VVIPFGPPFKPVVDLAPRSGAEVNLKLSLVGAGGDVCSNFYVEGKRPGEPSFTIAGPDGKPVVEGKFKFG